MDITAIAPDYRMTRSWGIRQLYTEMLPGLWMGGTLDRDVVGVMVSVNAQHDTYTSPPGAAPEITKQHFDAVVTLYHCARPVGLGVEELRFGFADDARQEEPEPINELALADAVSWAHLRWSTGQRVLIRCQAGLNRSGLVTALVLMDTGMPLDQIVTLLRSKRSPRVLHNPHFLRYLQAVEDARTAAVES